MPFFKHLIDSKAGYLPVTDERMTRFWITLQEGVNAVLQYLPRMFEAKSSFLNYLQCELSIWQKVMAPDIDIKVVGIRPGEKLHEICVLRNTLTTL